MSIFKRPLNRYDIIWIICWCDFTLLTLMYWLAHNPKDEVFIVVWIKKLRGTYHE